MRLSGPSPPAETPNAGFSEKKPKPLPTVDVFHRIVQWIRGPAREAGNSAPTGVGGKRLFKGTYVCEIRWLDALKCFPSESLDMVKGQSIPDNVRADTFGPVVLNLVVALGRGLRR